MRTFPAVFVKFVEFELLLLHNFSFIFCNFENKVVRISQIRIQMKEYFDNFIKECKQIKLEIITARKI